MIENRCKNREKARDSECCGLMTTSEGKSVRLYPLWRAMKQKQGQLGGKIPSKNELPGNLEAAHYSELP